MKYGSHETSCWQHHTANSPACQQFNYNMVTINIVVLGAIQVYSLSCHYVNLWRDRQIWVIAIPNLVTPYHCCKWSPDCRIDVQTVSPRKLIPTFGLNSLDNRGVIAFGLPLARARLFRPVGGAGMQRFHRNCRKPIDIRRNKGYAVYRTKCPHDLGAGRRGSRFRTYPLVFSSGGFWQFVLS
jgi:hypothetical protein